MKLIEILAREVKEWPEDAHELGQWPDGAICIRAEAAGQPCQQVYRSNHIADDVDVWCTRAQWEAERARIAAMEGISAFSQEQANAEAEREQRTQYEQELWDRVAMAAIQGVVASEAFHTYHNPKEALGRAAFFGADVADAFMAERAKRMAKKQQTAFVD